MAVLALTRAQVIAQGLSLAGRPDLTSDARLWLNLFLEKQYMSQDFKWLVKTATGLTVTDGTAFPTDYRAAKSGVLRTPEDSLAQIDVFDASDEYDAKRMAFGSISTGQPRSVYANHDLRKFYFLPQPDQTYSWELQYYYMPTIPTHADSSGDSETIKWGLPSSILVDHIKAMAFEYNDDQRQTSAKQEVANDISQGKMNDRDKRAGSTRINMGKSFRNRFR